MMLYKARERRRRAPGMRKQVEKSVKKMTRRVGLLAKKPLSCWHRGGGRKEGMGNKLVDLPLFEVS
jgi:hypothetical protein